MDSRVTDLIAEAADLERKINALLARPDGGQDALRFRWGLTHGQARVVAALADGSAYHISELAKIYSSKGDGNEGTVRTELHRIRKKISPLKIRSIYGRGYRLDEPDLSTVIGIMGDSDE